MTPIAWQWSWPEVDSHLLVSQDVASLLESYRQRRFDVERGGQLFVDPSSATGLVLALATTPQALPDWYSPWRLPLIKMIGQAEPGLS